MKKILYLLVLLAAVYGSPYAKAYGWPVKPFDQPHPIQGNFDDPRMSTRKIDDNNPKNEKHFHSGIDIAAPTGTPVYAIGSGRARLISGTAVSIRSSWGRFEYWHVTPAVRKDEMVKRHQLIGWVAPRPGGKGGEHVHLSEWRDGSYVNPRRSGGIAPDPDATPPVIQFLMRESGRVTTRAEQENVLLVRGVVGLFVNIYDEPYMQPPRPWDHIRLSPTVVSWWLKTPEGKLVLRPATVADFRTTFWKIPLETVYGPGTIQNGPRVIGRYNLRLGRRWDTRKIPDGIYVLVVQAADTGGNTVRKGFPIQIVNTPPSG